MSARYDLHVHTSNSDGLMSPREVLQRATTVAGLVLSDHSAITWGSDLVAAARAAGVRLLFPGTEISTMHDGRKYHVLAYGHALLNQEFRDYAFHPTRVKNDVYSLVIDDLVASGHELPTYADMLAGVGAGAVRHPTKWMMSKTLIGHYLVEGGVAAEAAKTLLMEKYEQFRSRRADRYLPTTDVVATVRDFGGVAAIAHPWWECPSGVNSPQRVLDDLRLFRERGLLGLEVSTRHQTVGTEAERRAAADHLGLLPVAGSDFHANGKTSIGQFGVTEQELGAIHEAAAARGVSL